MSGRSPAAILYDESGNPVGVTLDGSVYRLQAVTKVLNSSGSQIDPATQATLASIKDTDGVKKITDPLPAGTNRIGAVRPVDANDVALDLARDNSIPVGSRGILTVGEDGSAVARALDIRIDPNDGRRRVQIEGKVLATTTPIPPPSSTPVSIANDSPLSITTTADITYIIPNGQTFYIQQVLGGCEGDTSERGSVIEVFYYDGTVDHIIERVYINGFTTYVTINDYNKSRDGTLMTGNGTTKLIRVRRRRLSGSSQEVDAVVRGYVQ